MRIAFSTVGCPELSLEEVARSASAWGYQGVELRVSPAAGGAPLPSDPLRADAAEMRGLFADAGVDLLSIATGVRFDAPVWPPVLGHLLGGAETGVPETKEAVSQAARAGAFFVRVFGHELPGGEPRAWGLRRVSERLALAAQTARNTPVRVLIENGGSFSRAAELAELHGLVNSPFLSMTYNIVPAVLAGENPLEGVETLLHGLRVVKVGDVAEDGKPVALGRGVMPVEPFVRHLREIGYEGWIVYEHPVLWRPEMRGAAGDAGASLGAAAATLFAWAGLGVGV